MPEAKTGGDDLADDTGFLTADRLKQYGVDYMRQQHSRFYAKVIAECFETATDFTKEPKDKVLDAAEANFRKFSSEHLLETLGPAGTRLHDSAKALRTLIDATATDDASELKSVIDFVTSKNFMWSKTFTKMPVGSELLIRGQKRHLSLLRDLEQHERMNSIRLPGMYKAVEFITGAWWMTKDGYPRKKEWDKVASLYSTLVTRSSRAFIVKNKAQLDNTKLHLKDGRSAAINYAMDAAMDTCGGAKLDKIIGKLSEGVSSRRATTAGPGPGDSCAAAATEGLVLQAMFADCKRALEAAAAMLPRATDLADHALFAKSESDNDNVDKLLHEWDDLLTTLADVARVASSIAGAGDGAGAVGLRFLEGAGLLSPCLTWLGNTSSVASSSTTADKHTLNRAIINFRRCWVIVFALTCSVNSRSRRDEPGQSDLGL